MNVTLKPELEKLIDEDVKAGRVAGTSEFINRAVYHYALARDLGEDYSAEELDEMISEGLQDIERGDTIEGGEAFRYLRSLNEQRRRARQQPV